MSTNDGGSAFPGYYAPGMTLRDYFKAAAIPAAVHLWAVSSESQRMTWSDCQDIGLLCARDYPKFINNVTEWIADEMTAAREAKP